MSDTRVEKYPDLEGRCTRAHKGRRSTILRTFTRSGSTTWDVSSCDRPSFASTLRDVIKWLSAACGVVVRPY